jgi:hypothetical protein
MRTDDTACICTGRAAAQFAFVLVLALIVDSGRQELAVK